MKITGILLIAIGLLWELIALSMGISIVSKSEIYGSREIVNSEKVSDRQTQIALAGLVILSGVALFGAGSVLAEVRKNNLENSTRHDALLALLHPEPVAPTPEEEPTVTTA